MAKNIHNDISQLEIVAFGIAKAMTKMSAYDIESIIFHMTKVLSDARIV
jgi:hypothetical protein